MKVKVCNITPILSPRFLSLVNIVVLLVIPKFCIGVLYHLCRVEPQNSQGITGSQLLTIGVVCFESWIGNSSSSSLMMIRYSHVPEIDCGGGMGIGSGEGTGSECFR